MSLWIRRIARGAALGVVTVVVTSAGPVGAQAPEARREVAGRLTLPPPVEAAEGSGCEETCREIRKACRSTCITDARVLAEAERRGAIEACTAPCEATLAACLTTCAAEGAEAR